jgi:hypothetical protein
LQQTYTQTVLASDSINLLSYDFPLTAPAYPTLIADNFEDNSCADWWNGDGLNLAVVSNSPSELAALPGLGNFSLDLSSSSADTYAGYAGVYVGKPVTPAYNALQVVVYGYGANSGILTIELRDDDDHNYQFDAAADDVFTYNLNVNWKGWQIITIPFGKFQLKSGSAGDGIFNPGSENDTSAGLLQINFTTNNDQPTSRFHIKIDSLRFAAY